MWAKTEYKSVPNQFEKEYYNQKWLPTDGLVPDIQATMDKVRRFTKCETVDHLKISPYVIDRIPVSYFIVEDTSSGLKELRYFPRIPKEKFPKQDLTN